LTRSSSATAAGNSDEIKEGDDSGDGCNEYPLVENVLVRLEPMLRSEILTTDVESTVRVSTDIRRARFIGPR